MLHYIGGGFVALQARLVPSAVGTNVVNRSRGARSTLHNHSTPAAARLGDVCRSVAE